MATPMKKNRPFHDFRSLSEAAQDLEIAKLQGHLGFTLLQQRMQDQLGTNFTLSGKALEMELIKSACIREGVDMVFREVEILVHLLNEGKEG